MQALFNKMQTHQEATEGERVAALIISILTKIQRGETITHLSKVNNRNHVG